MQRVLLPYRDTDTIEAYKAAVRQAGMEPVAIETNGELSLDGCAGLLLTGGSDVNPKLYGEAPHPKTEPPDDERDSIEYALLEEAFARDLPLFAICRGLQILNVYQGGTLTQHLPSITRHQRRNGDRAMHAHDVEVVPGTLLATATGQEKLAVNSRHHQAINTLGKGLHVSARDSEDGTIEAVEVPGKRYALAVQWHPENQVFADLIQLTLLRSFANAL